MNIWEEALSATLRMAGSLAGALVIVLGIVWIANCLLRSHFLISLLGLPIVYLGVVIILWVNNP